MSLQKNVTYFHVFNSTCSLDTSTFATRRSQWPRLSPMILSSTAVRASLPHNLDQSSDNRSGALFAEFLADTKSAAFNYSNQVDKMLASNRTRLVISLDDLRDHGVASRQLADG